MYTHRHTHKHVHVEYAEWDETVCAGRVESVKETFIKHISHTLLAMTLICNASQMKHTMNIAKYHPLATHSLLCVRTCICRRLYQHITGEFVHT